MGYSMRTDRWRYTEWIQEKDGKVIARELYDHEIDPQENSNLSEEAAQETRVLQLSDLLRRERSGWKSAAAPQKISSPADKGAL